MLAGLPVSLSSTRRDRPGDLTSLRVGKRAPDTGFNSSFRSASRSRKCAGGSTQTDFSSGPNEMKQTHPRLCDRKSSRKTDSRTSRSTAEYAIGWDLAGDEGWQGWPQTMTVGRSMATVRTANLTNIRWLPKHPIVRSAQHTTSNHDVNSAGPRDAFYHPGEGDNIEETSLVPGRLAVRWH